MSATCVGLECCPSQIFVPFNPICDVNEEPVTNFCDVLQVSLDSGIITWINDYETHFGRTEIDFDANVLPLKGSYDNDWWETPYTYCAWGRDWKSGVPDSGLFLIEDSNLQWPDLDMAQPDPEVSFTLLIQTVGSHVMLYYVSTGYNITGTYTLAPLTSTSDYGNLSIPGTIIVS